MAPRKLSDSDKGAIIELYKQPHQTTSTLAEQYGVSNSTISRILKTTLPPDEYGELIAQKRMVGSDKAEAPAPSPLRQKPVSPILGDTALTDAPLSDTALSDTALVDIATVDLAESDPQPEDGLENWTTTRPEVGRPKLKTAAEKDEAKKSGTSRRRRNSRRKDEEDGQLPLLGRNSPNEADEADEAESDLPVREIVRKSGAKLVPFSASGLDADEDDDDDLLGLDETLGEDFGDDDELDDDDDDDDDDDLDGDDFELPKPKLQSTAKMSIMPLGQAVMPKPCYLVVDMRSELITRPLSDFADLGQIPSDEEKAKTLPVFDNHRVARRFSRNKQRVIKVPDGDLISRTSPYLEAKGITRMLVDGQVFDLCGR